MSNNIKIRDQRNTSQIYKNRLADFLNGSVTLLLIAVFLILFFMANLGMVQSAKAGTVRIKDITNVQGVRNNVLIGYGLVVGLNGTGDDTGASDYTKESIISMLERLGVNIRNNAAVNIKGKNIAAVMVTATLPPFARKGTEIDITVSAIGDAKSLVGGTLLVTPLMGADGNVYAVAQGSVNAGGFAKAGKAASVTRNVPTSGKIPNGAIVEKEIGFELNKIKRTILTLKNPDFTTASRIAQAINAYTGEKTARAKDPTTITIRIPSRYYGRVMPFLTKIEQIRITPDQIAKVVIDEQNGVIVMGENVKVSTVAISQGNLTIKITEADQVSQPSAFSSVGTTGKDARVDRTKVEVKEADNKLTIVSETVSLQHLVNSLNALGVTPRDMITILQAIKAAGALQADIEVI